MEPNKRPMIKLKIGAKPSTQSEAISPAQLSTANPQKLKLKIGSRAETEPAPDATEFTSVSKPKNILKFKTPKPPASTKPPTATSNPRKRIKSDAGPTPSAQKKLKLNQSKATSAPALRLKHKGRPPSRPLGAGYDSEASDREEDPSIEEEFILRMEPGEDCDYLRKAIEERKFGPVKEGGADIQMKFLTRDGRRAAITIRGRIYAASLVDLPCIVEGMKSWDKRGWYKTADISQMLLVLGRVKTEEETRSFPLPQEVDEKSWQYAHGLTPPMHWVRRRRFRPRVSYNAIEEVERDVALLLKRDEDAVEPPVWELIETARLTREASMHPSDDATSQEYDDEQDAEGEADDSVFLNDAGLSGVYTQDDNAGDDDLAADLEAAFAEEIENDDDTEDAGTPAFLDTLHFVEDGTESGSVANSPADVLTPFTKATSGDESSGEEDEADEDDGGSIDEDALERQQNLQQQRDEINDIEAAIAQEQARWASQTNTILRQKMYRKVQSLKEDLSIKKSAIGEGDD